MRMASPCFPAVLAALVTLAAGACAVAQSSAGVSGIAFVSIRSGDPQIHVRDSQGRERAITRGNGLPGQPDWASTDRVAYVARVGASTRIFVTDAAGLAVARLTSDDAVETAPSWSPDGQALAYFSRPVSGGSVELRITQLASGSTVTLARNAKDMGPTPASWSADGSRLVFGAADDSGRPHVWFVQRDGGGLRNLSAKLSSRGGAGPSISPDGTKALWVADMRERVPVVVTDIDSGESKDLTPEKVASNETARWSPDGRSIVFASARDAMELGRNDVFVMNADGSNVRNLSRHPAEDFNPKWAADGRSVVFASLRSGTSLLYEVDLVNGSTKVVSEHPSHDMDHVVKPMLAATAPNKAVAN